MSAEIQSSNAWASKDCVALEEEAWEGDIVVKKRLTFRLASGSCGSENKLSVKEKGLYWMREKHGYSTPKSHFHSS